MEDDNRIQGQTEMAQDASSNETNGAGDPSGEDLEMESQSDIERGDQGNKEEEKQSVPITTGLLEILPTELVLQIFNFLPLHTIGKMRNLNTKFRKEMDQHLERKLRSLLRKYVDDVELFREYQRVLGALISGSTALHFISADDSWVPKDLDIYVPHHHREAFVNFLISKEGYQVSEKITGPTYKQELVDCPRLVCKLVKTKSVLSGVELDQVSEIKVMIDIMECRFGDPLHCITDFHSTEIMNYIAHDRVCVLYPTLTFCHMGYAKPKIKNEREVGCISKYESRGYTILRDTYLMGSKHKRPCGLSCPKINRPTPSGYSSTYYRQIKDAASYNLDIPKTKISCPRLYESGFAYNLPKAFWPIQHDQSEKTNDQETESVQSNSQMWNGQDREVIFSICESEGKKVLEYDVDLDERWFGLREFTMHDRLACVHKTYFPKYAHEWFFCRCRNPLCRHSSTFGLYHEVAKVMTP